MKKSSRFKSSRNVDLPDIDVPKMEKFKTAPQITTKSLSSQAQSNTINISELNAPSRQQLLLDIRNTKSLKSITGDSTMDPHGKIIEKSDTDLYRKHVRFINLARDEKRKEYISNGTVIWLSTIKPWKDETIETLSAVALGSKVNFVENSRKKQDKAAKKSKSKKSAPASDSAFRNLRTIAGDEIVLEATILGKEGLVREKGHAMVCCGYRLPAQYVIFVHGPVGQDATALENCYVNALDIAIKMELKTIALPCISTGGYGYPREAAAKVALRTVRRHVGLSSNINAFSKIVFCTYDNINTITYLNEMRSVFPSFHSGSQALEIGAELEPIKLIKERISSNKMTSLGELSMAGAPWITDMLFWEIYYCGGKSGLPNLIKLTCAGCHLLSDMAFWCMSTCMPKLESVIADYCYSVTERSIVALQSCSCLKVLSLRGTSVRTIPMDVPDKLELILDGWLDLQTVLDKLKINAAPSKTESITVAKIHRNGHSSKLGTITSISDPTGTQINIVHITKNMIPLFSGPGSAFAINCTTDDSIIDIVYPILQTHPDSYVMVGVPSEMKNTSTPVEDILKKSIDFCAGSISLQQNLSNMCAVRFMASEGGRLKFLPNEELDSSGMLSMHKYYMSKFPRRLPLISAEKFLPSGDYLAYHRSEIITHLNLSDREANAFIDLLCSQKTLIPIKENWLLPIKNLPKFVKLMEKFSSATNKISANNVQLPWLADDVSLISYSTMVASLRESNCLCINRIDENVKFRSTSYEYLNVEEGFSPEEIFLNDLADIGLIVIVRAPWVNEPSGQDIIVSSSEKFGSISSVDLESIWPRFWEDFDRETSIAYKLSATLWKHTLNQIFNTVSQIGVVTFAWQNGIIYAVGCVSICIQVKFELEKLGKGYFILMQARTLNVGKFITAKPPTPEETKGVRKHFGYLNDALAAVVLQTRIHVESNFRKNLIFNEAFAQCPYCRVPDRVHWFRLWDLESTQYENESLIASKLACNTFNETVRTESIGLNLKNYTFWHSYLHNSQTKGKKMSLLDIQHDCCHVLDDEASIEPKTRICSMCSQILPMTVQNVYCVTCNMCRRCMNYFKDSYTLLNPRIDFLVESVSKKAFNSHVFTVAEYPFILSFSAKRGMIAGARMKLRIMVLEKPEQIFLCLPNSEGYLLSIEQLSTRPYEVVEFSVTWSTDPYPPRLHINGDYGRDYTLSHVNWSFGLRLTGRDSSVMIIDSELAITRTAIRPGMILEHQTSKNDTNETSLVVVSGSFSDGSLLLKPVKLILLKSVKFSDNKLDGELEKEMENNENEIGQFIDSKLLHPYGYAENVDLQKISAGLQPTIPQTLLTKQGLSGKYQVVPSAFFTKLTQTGTMNDFAINIVDEAEQKYAEGLPSCQTIYYVQARDPRMLNWSESPFFAAQNESAIQLKTVLPVQIDSKIVTHKMLFDVKNTNLRHAIFWLISNPSNTTPGHDDESRKATMLNAGKDIYFSCKLKSYDQPVQAKTISSRTNQVNHWYSAIMDSDLGIKCFTSGLCLYLTKISYSIVDSDNISRQTAENMQRSNCFLLSLLGVFFIDSANSNLDGRLKLSTATTVRLHEAVNRIDEKFNASEEEQVIINMILPPPESPFRTLHWTRTFRSLSLAFSESVLVNLFKKSSNTATISLSLLDDIGKNCCNLSVLRLSNIPVKTLPDSFANLSNALTVLILLNIPLQKLPLVIFKLTKLTKLEITSCSLSHNIPTEIGNLRHLVKLLFSQNNLDFSHFPSSFSNLRQLRSLTINQMDQIGLNFETFDMTQFIQHCYDKMMLKYIEMFDFYENDAELSSASLTSMTPEFFQKFVKLISSHVKEETGISGFGANAIDLEGIRKLRAMIANQFESAKECLDETPFKFFPAMQDLSFTCSNLQTDPSFILHHKRLERLNLNDGLALTQLNENLGGLERLKNINLDRCRSLKTPPPEIVRKGSKSVIAYLRRLMLGQQTCWRTKLMLVGLGGAGKTSLARALMSGSYKSNGTKAEEITDGIEIADWTVKTVTNETIQYSVWDFAGQAVYYNTHQFFLSKRAVYLLLWNTRLGHEHAGLEFWLSSISCHAPGTPIFIIGSHADQVARADLPREQLKETFPQIVQFCHVSALTGQGMEDLSNKLLQVTLQLKYMGEQIPKVYLNFERDLMFQRARKENLLTLKAVETIGQRHTLMDSLEVRQGLEFLHGLGSIQFFDKELLKDRVIINPQWLVDVMACLITVKDSAIKNGKFEEESIMKIWKQYPQNLHKWLLHLTEEFDLTFLLPDDGMRVVPCLLPEEEPEYEWPELKDDSREMKIAYKFEYLPAGLFNRTQSRLCQFSDSSAIWKKGSLLKRNNHMALVRQTHENELVVKVQGMRPENVLFLIHEVIEGLIKESFQGVSYDLLLPCLDCVRNKSQDPYMFSARLVRRASDLKAPFLQCAKQFHILSTQMLLDVMPPTTLDDLENHLKTMIRELNCLKDDVGSEVSILCCGKDIHSVNALQSNKDKIYKAICPTKLQKDLQKEKFVCTILDRGDCDSVSKLGVELMDSQIIVACISDNFVNDSNSATLFTYIRQTLCKPIVVVVLAVTDKWKHTSLGMLIGDDLYVDLSKPERYDTKLKELVTRLSAKVVKQHKQKVQPPPVFISYCWVNSKEAVKKGSRRIDGAIGHLDPRELLKKLSDESIECWIDVKDGATQSGGGGLFEKIAEGLKEAKLLVACISDEYVNSINAMREFRFAVGMLKLPVILIVVGTGVAWQYSEAVMLAINAKRFDFRQEFTVSNFEAFVDTVNGMLSSLNVSNAMIEKHSKSENPASYFELCELTQRKFLQKIQLISQTVYPTLDKMKKLYPYLYLLDVIDIKKCPPFQLDESEANQADSDTSKQSPLTNLFTIKNTCIRVLCENDKGWHLMEDHYPIQAPIDEEGLQLEQHQLLQQLIKEPTYMAQIYAILHYSAIPLEVFKHPSIKEIQQTIELNASGDFRLSDSYTILMKLLLNVASDFQGKLKRSYMASHKKLWLCESHQKYARGILDDALTTSTDEIDISLVANERLDQSQSDVITSTRHVEEKDINSDDLMIDEINSQHQINKIPKTGSVRSQRSTVSVTSKQSIKLANTASINSTTASRRTSAASVLRKQASKMCNIQ